MIYETKAEAGKEPNEWRVSKLVDVGAEEIFQARFLALREFLNATIDWNEEQKKSINDLYWSMVLEGYTSAFLHLRTARAMSADPEAPSLNLRAEYDSFYSKLWTAYQHRLCDLTLAMGYKLKFLFADGEERFLAEGKRFVEQHQFAAEILPFLGAQRVSWQNKLSVIRNKVIQHPQLTGDAIKVIYDPNVASAYFDHCWQTAEYLIALMFAKHFPPFFELVELPHNLREDGRKVFTYQINPNIPG